MKHYYYIKTDIHIYIYDMTVDELLTHIPPCKECLIQPMCMYVTKCMTDKIKPKVVVKACKGLEKFMKGKKCFKNLLL